MDSVAVRNTFCGRLAFFNEFQANMKAYKMMEKRRCEIVPRGKRFKPPVKVVFEKLVAPVDHGSELFSKSFNFGIFEEKAVICFLPPEINELMR